MSRHNYTNPAFCQQSEFYPDTVLQKELKNVVNSGAGEVRVQRSESTRCSQQASFVTKSRIGRGTYNQQPSEQQNQVSGTPPRPGPKPGGTRTGSGRYALVPVEELPTNNKGRYAVIPGPKDPNIVIQRFAKSQDHIDRFSDMQDDEPQLYKEKDNFASLPPISPNTSQTQLTRLKSAFSSDFSTKSFVLVDQKSNQRYAVVPTGDDEEIVDENHEIIQMHNGRAHRYAVIPTEEEETCLSNSDIANSSAQHHSYAVISSYQPPMKTSTPQKGRLQTVSQPSTPIKNSLATQKLHEILSTPRKPAIQRQHSLRCTPTRYHSQQILSSTPKTLTKQEFTPQRLQYEIKEESRSTAVITPRVAPSLHNNYDDSNLSKSLNKNSSFQKVANATATIGAVSLMLILGGALNSGLCLYMIFNMGRSYYLDIGVVAGFAAVALGILGFKSRHCDWLPNRNYISGYILVTVFSLLKCCGLLILLAMHPYPGTPLHDVTTGVVLGLSSLTLLLISLGVITSRWCMAPPPDNRVDVY